jgi:hypothetical protein
MATPSIQTLITQAQQVLNLKSTNEIRATLAAVLANANVGTPLNPNLTTQQLWDEFYEIVRQPSDDIMSIVVDQMMRMVFSPPAPGGAGADKQVIFNDGGVLAGDAGLTYNKATDALTITGDLTVDTSTLKVDSTNNRVGVGLASGMTAPLEVQSNTSGTGINIRGRADNANALRFFANDGTTQQAYIGGDDSNIDIVSASTRPIRFIVNGAVVASVLNGGNVSIANGNLVMSTSGKGIDFSAVTGGTGTATGNVLNDYEEGTFTPSITFGGASVGMTGTFSGRYTKVGRAVTVNGIITLTAKGSSTGNAKLTGLPFTSANAAGEYTSVSLRLDRISFLNVPCGYVGQNVSVIELENITTAGTVTNLTDANFINTSVLIFNCTYSV